MNPNDALNHDIIHCERCTRLIPYCREAAQHKRAAYKDQVYWGKPAPNFGDSHAAILLVGLAPGAQGANRTGRMFTGDPSGDFLTQALFDVGLANQPTSTDRNDGLVLNQVMITGVAHCAPPANKLTAEERANCAPFLVRTIDALPKLKVIVALGGVAWDALFRHFNQPRLKFGHRVLAKTDSGIPLLACYHPSPHNTYTKRLTQNMLTDLLNEAKNIANID